MNKVKLYFRNLLISLDSFGATLIGGQPDETISGRAARARKHGLKIGTVGANVIDAVAAKVFRDKNHCDEAMENDKLGRHEEAVPVE